MKFKMRRATPGILFAIGLAITIAGIFLAFPNQQSVDQSGNAQEFCQKQLHERSFMKTELLFGLSKPNQSMITEAEFQRFIDQQVTPLFPDGLTLLDATGQFKTSNKIVKEGSKLLLLLYPASTESYSRIEQIRSGYKNTFQQQSVLRIDDRSCISF